MFAKVIDFGVAKSQQAPQSLQTVTGALVGTPHYMSPEQANGTREVDHRSDLWALGIITMQCLTGKRPFESLGGPLDLGDSGEEGEQASFRLGEGAADGGGHVVLDATLGSAAEMD